MKYDDVLALIGEFGRYQKIIYILLALPIMFTGIQVMSPVFTLATPKHRCSLPFLDNDTFAIQSPTHQELVDLYIPWDTINDEYSKCLIYKKPLPLSYKRQENITGDVQSESNTTETENCRRWVYDDSIFEDTAITDTNLVCSATIYKAHATTASGIGSIFSFLASGPLSDRYGRKALSMVSLIITIISTSLLTWLPNIYVFIAIRAIIGFGIGVFYNVVFVYALEFIGQTKRTLYGMLFNHFWAFGLFVQALAAYYIRAWRVLQLVTSLPLAFFLFYWWKLPNSGRWLFANGHIEEGKKVLRTMSKVNKAFINTDSLTIDDLGEEEEQSKPRKKSCWLGIELFKHKTITLWSLVVVFNCITVVGGIGAMTVVRFKRSENRLAVSVVYYGLSLNIANMSGDIYTNFAVSATMELAAYTICIPGIHFIGRKKFHCVCMLTAGVVLLLDLVPELVGNNSTEWLSILFAQIGKLASSAAYAVLYLFTAELFPTVLRGTVLGLCGASATIGGFVAPYIVEMANLLEGQYVKIIPMTIFGTISFVAGLLSLYLPETSNMQLPDTIDDMISQRRGDSDRLKSKLDYTAITRTEKIV